MIKLWMHFEEEYNGMLVLGVTSLVQVVNPVKIVLLFKAPGYAFDMESNKSSATYRLLGHTTEIHCLSLFLDMNSLLEDLNFVRF